MYTETKFHSPCCYRTHINCLRSLSSKFDELTARFNRYHFNEILSYYSLAILAVIYRVLLVVHPLFSIFERRRVMYYDHGVQVSFVYELQLLLSLAY